MDDELRKRGTSAANLRFLSFIAARSFRNLNFKGRIRIIELLVPLCFPKFVLEVAAMDDELRKRGTSAANLRFLSFIAARSFWERQIQGPH